MNTTSTHADPSHPAIAAILSVDLDGDRCHDTLAALLAPHVADAPALREWTEDDEWSAAEEAVAAAGRFVETHACPTGKDPWLIRQNDLDRLRRMQGIHRGKVILDRLGEFQGYVLRVQEWLHGGVVRVWEAGVLTDVTPSMLELPLDVTASEVRIAIKAWKSGHERGFRQGGAEVRDGIKRLLRIEEE